MLGGTSARGSQPPGPGRQRRLSTMRLSELHAMEAKLQQQAMRSAIDSTKTSIRASHAQERKQFRESRRPAASAGKLGRGGRRPSVNP